MAARDALPQHNMAAVSEAVATRVAERTAIVWRDRRLSFQDLTHRSRQLAHLFNGHRLGANPAGRTGLASHESHQDHVAIYAHNGNEYLEAILGAFKARVLPVNINYRYVAEELLFVLRTSGVRAIVFHSTFAQTLAEVLPELPELRLLLQIDDGSTNALLPGARWYEEALSAAPATLPDAAIQWSPDDLYMLFTGGTTGMPKGVLWRQADIHRTAMGGRNPLTRQPWASLDEVAQAAVDNPAPGVVLPAAPFMHGAGHWTAFAALNQGNTVVIQDDITRLDPVDICSVIERERVTYLQIIGDAFGRPIIEEMERGTYDLSSMRTLLSGGTALSTSCKERFLARLPQITLIESVGSSEGGGQATQMTTAGATIIAATFSPVEGTVVVAADLDRVLQPGDDETGWLAKRGPDIPIGYLGDADKTARTFPIIEGERVSVPGDRARWLADGTIELLGRESVTINSGGEKIFAEEVEAAIIAHPDVDDVVVTSRPSERWGQEVVAVVSLRAGASTSTSALAAEAARHIARYKLPKAWVFVEEIKRSPAGKADYRWAAGIAAANGRHSGGR